MQTKTKSAILLLAVLALGILIGVLVSGVLVNRRMDRLARMRTGPGMAFFIEQAVKPQSEEQREQIRAVLDAAAPRFAEAFERTRAEMDALSDSLMVDLADVLTEDQMKQLRQHLTMRSRRAARGRGREADRPRGPPPGAPEDGRPPHRPPPGEPPPD